MTKETFTLSTIESHLHAMITSFTIPDGTVLELQVKLTNDPNNCAYDMLQRYAHSNAGSAGSISSMMSDGLTRFVSRLEGKRTFRLLALTQTGHRLACEEFTLSLPASDVPKAAVQNQGPDYSPIPPRYEPSMFGWISMQELALEVSTNIPGSDIKVEHYELPISIPFIVGAKEFLHGERTPQCNFKPVGQVCNTPCKHFIFFYGPHDIRVGGRLGEFRLIDSRNYVDLTNSKKYARINGTNELGPDDLIAVSAVYFGYVPPELESCRGYEEYFVTTFIGEHRIVT